jgi:hypothetical protein
MIHDQLPQWATSTGKNAYTSMYIIFTMQWFLYVFIIRSLIFFLFGYLQTLLQHADYIIFNGNYIL